MTWMLLPFRRLYALIEGRSCRREYWMFILLNILILSGFLVIVGATLGASFFSPSAIQGALAGAGIALIIVLYIPLVLWSMLVFPALIGVTVRRFHDLNLSGWIYFGMLVASAIPFVNFIVWIILTVMMCLPGTQGANRYGADPLNPDTDALT